MKPNEIKKVLNIAKVARKNNLNFIPLFTGAPGIAKSSVCQQWVEEQKKLNENFGFIDLRAAYLEAPDIIGYPSVVNINGRQTTVHNLPEFLPTEGEGLLLLEEINRGTTSVMNIFMQLLTDRKIHTYTLPDGWIIASCINPENEFNDVNHMDAALKNRFEIFEIDYSKTEFIEYMQEKDFDPRIIAFIKSGAWTYVKPENMGDKPGTVYLSNRNWEKLNNVIKCGIPTELTKEFFNSILGKNVGGTFYAFCYDETPVTFNDLKKSFLSSITKLIEYGKPGKYRNDLISVTVADLIRNQEEIETEKLVELMVNLPADQTVSLLQGLQKTKNNQNYTKELCESYPKLKKYLQDTFKPKESE